MGTLVSQPSDTYCSYSLLQSAINNKELTQASEQIDILYIDSVEWVSEGVHLVYPIVKHTSYWPNGNIQYTAYFFNGNPFGEWIFYTHNGERYFKCVYTNNSTVLTFENQNKIIEAHVFKQKKLFKKGVLLSYKDGKVANKTSLHITQKQGFWWQLTPNQIAIQSLTYTSN